MNEMQDSSHEKKKHASKFLILGLVCAIVGAPILGGMLAMTKKQVAMETAIGSGWNTDLETVLLNSGYKDMAPTSEEEKPTDTQSQSLTTRVKNAEAKVTQLLASLNKMRTVSTNRSKKITESTSDDSNDDAQLNQLRDEILRLQNEIQTLQERMATNSNSIPAPTAITHTTINSGDVSNVTNQVEMVEKRILIETERILEIEKEKTDSLSNEVDELTGRKEQLETEISDLKTSVDDTTLDNIELKKTIETKDEQLDQLNNNLEASKNESVLLRSELGDVYDAQVENNTLIFTPHVTQTQKAE